MGSIRREGAIAGVIGATVVVLWFMAIDLATRGFGWTPAAIFAALFQSAKSPRDVSVSFANLAVLTIVHYGVFIAFGLLAALLVSNVERDKEVLFGAVLLLVTLETMFLGFAALAVGWLVAALSIWAILGANLLAGLAMGIYIWRAHPGLHTQLARDYEDADFAGGSMTV